MEQTIRRPEYQRVAGVGAERVPDAAVLVGLAKTLLSDGKQGSDLLYPLPVGGLQRQILSRGEGAA